MSTGPCVALGSRSTIPMSISNGSSSLTRDLTYDLKLAQATHLFIVNAPAVPAVFSDVWEPSPCPNRYDSSEVFSHYCQIHSAILIISTLGRWTSPEPVVAGNNEHNLDKTRPLMCLSTSAALTPGRMYILRNLMESAFSLLTTVSWKSISKPGETQNVMFQ